MAFIKEKVLEKLELFESFNLTYDGKKREANESTMWYVDKEREIYFIYLGGGAWQIPTTYLLIWKNRKVIIDVEVRPTENEVHWKIESIKSSNQLQKQKDDLINIIKEIGAVMYKKRGMIIEAIPNILFVEESRLNG